MFFILQKEKNDFIDVEVFNLWDILKKQKYLYDVTFMDLEEIKKTTEDELKQAIPVGSLSFVGSWLKKYHNVQDMNPIEVPDVLRTDKFLKRKYSIVEKDELPQNGYFFCKDASQLKSFSFSGCIESFRKTENDLFKNNNLYVVSEVVPIEAEYRVIVMNDQIEAIQFYDGYPTIFPDVELIKNVVNEYRKDIQRPKAYALDIAVIQNRGTCVIENHPTTSFGTYGYVSNNLPYMYKYGIDYYINVNKKISKWHNNWF